MTVTVIAAVAALETCRVSAVPFNCEWPGHERELGFYLQPEFPRFGGDFETDARLRDYCLAESKRILDTYGNHPPS